MIPAKRLSELLEPALAVVKGKSVIPILSSVLIGVDGEGALSIEATDTEVAVRVGERIEDHFTAVAIPAKEIYAASKSFSGDIELEITADGVNIAEPGSKMRLRGLDRLQFPSMPFISTSGPSFPSHRLHSALKPHLSVLSEMADWMTPKVWLVMSGNGAEVVSFSDHTLLYTRLATDYEDVDAAEDTYAITEPAVRAALRTEGEITVSGDESFVQLSTPQISVLGRRLEGKPADWRGLLAKGERKEVWPFRTSDLLDAVKRCAVVAPDNKEHPPAVFLDFLADPARLVVRLAADLGHAETVVAPQEEIPDGWRVGEFCLTLSYLRGILQDAPTDLTYIATDPPLRMDLSWGEEDTYSTRAVIMGRVQ